MSVNKLNEIVIQPKKMLVTQIDDYYGSASEGSQWNSNIPENQKYRVGVVEKVGKDLPKEWVGHIVFYTAGFGKEINLKNLGSYLEIQDDLKILVRMDQTINNYK